MPLKHLRLPRKILDYVGNPDLFPDLDDVGFDGIIERAVQVYRSHTFSATGQGPCEPESTAVPIGEHTFSHAEFPGYKDPARSVLCMVDNPLTLVQRNQPSGLCHMHAPAVVQYYAVWHAALADTPNAVPGHGMLDLTWYIANRFSSDELEAHVFRNEGGSSADFLAGILMPGSQLQSIRVADCINGLRLYGPALVSRFRVFEDFAQAEVHKHDTVPTSETAANFRGAHAMVLVGARTDDAGRKFFLLQNWWKGKQFVEVSESYLTARLGGLKEAQFVITPQTGVPCDFRAHAAGIHYAETDIALEKAERWALEH